MLIVVLKKAARAKRYRVSGIKLVRRKVYVTIQ